MRIIVFGAAGNVGSRIVTEAVSRGHIVTGIVRNETKIDRLSPAIARQYLDVGDVNKTAMAISDHDLVISALRPPDGEEDKLPVLTKSVLDAAGMAGKRLLVVGGAANLLMPDNSGHTVLSAPDLLPWSVRPIAAACLAQFHVCVAADTDWVYFSPPAALAPGKRTGTYRRGTDILITDKAGNSTISMEDFAVAILDEAELPAANVRRVTAAY